MAAVSAVVPDNAGTRIFVWYWIFEINMQIFLKVYF